MKNLHLSIVGEKPVVVVLREGDLTQEEADRLEAGNTGQCTINTAHGVEGGGPHPGGGGQARGRQHRSVYNTRNIP